MAERITQGDQLEVFLAIATHHPKGICAKDIKTVTKPEDSEHSVRVSHHIKGLRMLNVIEIARQGKKRGQKSYRLTDKGERMFFQQTQPSGKKQTYKLDRGDHEEQN